MKTHNRFKKYLGVGALFFWAAGLLGCSAIGQDGAPGGNFDASNVPDAVPRAEPLSKYGNKPSYVVRGKRYSVVRDVAHYDKVGSASWYGTKFHGQRTSSYEPYDMYKMTAASTTLPIPSYVRVTNLENGRTVVVKVNDRGPFHSSRIIDLSYAAAKKLGYTGKGTAKVRVTGIDAGRPGESSGLFAQNKVGAPSPASLEKPKSSAVFSKTLASAKSSSKIQSKSHSLSKPEPKSPLLQLAQKSDKVYLQVGSFTTRSSAESVSKRLTKLTKSIQVAVKEGTKSGGSPVYRVHVGPLKNLQDSNQMAKLLAKNGFAEAKVVRG